MLVTFYRIIQRGTVKYVTAKNCTTDLEEETDTGTGSLIIKKPEYNLLYSGFF